MKPEELQELRDWCAKKIGLTLKDNNYMVPDEKWGHWRILFFKPDFKPDLPNGQIEMLIDKMVEEGWG